jgi:hemolysin activation/secretion protein
MNRTIWAAAMAALSMVTAMDATAQPVASAAAAARRVSVKYITVTGNTLLPSSAIDAMLARYQGERTLDELKDAARTLQEMYRQAGYGAVVAYLPEQALTDGKLVLAVLEGRVALVEVLGNKQFSAENVRRALPVLQEGQTPQVQRIDAQVQLANENPARKLALTLEAGANPGEVDARVNVTEDSVSRYTMSLDNTGSSQTGRVRMGLAYQNSALFDLDHQLALQAQFAAEHPGAVRIFSASYRVPVYSAGLMLGFYGTYSNVDAGSTPTAAGSLLFNGKGQVLGVSVMRLFDRLGEFEQRMTLSLDARDYLNNCAISGLPAGACGIAGESVTVHPLTLDYTIQRGGERPLALDIALTRNAELGGRYGGAANFEAVRPGAARGYQVMRLGGFAGVPVLRDWRIGLRLSAQASGDGLVPGEQFGLTGAGAVRGYEERELTGDSGISANAEFTSPALFDTQLRVLGFVDGGMVRNNLGTACNGTATRCTLGATGVGARYSFGPAQLKLDVARALRDGRVTTRNSTRVHFQASVSFQ